MILVVPAVREGSLVAHMDYQEIVLLTAAVVEVGEHLMKLVLVGVVLPGVDMVVI